MTDTQLAFVIRNQLNPGESSLPVKLLTAVRSFWNQLFPQLPFAVLGRMGRVFEIVIKGSKYLMEKRERKKL